jgi:hypothetical protein
MLARCNQAWQAAVIPALLVAPAAIAQTKRAWVDPPAELVAPHAQVSQPSPQAPAHATLSPPQAMSSTAPEIAASQSSAPRSNVMLAQPKPDYGSEDFSSGNLAQQNSVPSVRATLRHQSAQPARETVPRPTPPFNVAAAQHSVVNRIGAREQDARNLAQSYLSLWSASNQRTLQATPAFYGSEVMFHGRSMSFGALLAEKRRFVQRWPNRSYRYRTGTMGVKCDPNGRSCTIRSTFDFDAANARFSRRSRGVATHELVVSFAGKQPIIVAENSRVLGRASGR